MNFRVSSTCTDICGVWMERLDQFGVPKQGQDRSWVGTETSNREIWITEHQDVKQEIFQTACMWQGARNVNVCGCSLQENNYFLIFRINCCPLYVDVHRRITNNKTIFIEILYLPNPILERTRFLGMKWSTVVLNMKLLN